MCKGECDSHFQPRPTPLERLSKDLAAAENTIIDLKRRVEWWEKYPTEVGSLIVRLEKMEKALSEEMGRTREMDDILAGVVKKVGYMSDARAKAEFERCKADKDYCMLNYVTVKSDVPYSIAIDPKASPSGIPFSVALEYLKAGRRIRSAGAKADYFRMDASGVYYHNDSGVFREVDDISMQGLLANDWMVLPEKPQNP
jgi:hypothetical protein